MVLHNTLKCLDIPKAMLPAPLLHVDTSAVILDKVSRIRYAKALSFCSIEVNHHHPCPVLSVQSYSAYNLLFSFWGMVSAELNRGSQIAESLQFKVTVLKNSISIYTARHFLDEIPPLFTNMQNAIKKQVQNRYLEASCHISEEGALKAIRLFLVFNNPEWIAPYLKRVKLRRASQKEPKIV